MKATTTTTTYADTPAAHKQLIGHFFHFGKFGALNAVQHVRTLKDGDITFEEWGDCFGGTPKYTKVVDGKRIESSASEAYVALCQI